ncbi:MAG: D-sedoheptulose 7-phosphate isomerase [Candidatus Phaeomarinobacter sp.]
MLLTRGMCVAGELFSVGGNSPRRQQGLAQDIKTLYEKPCKVAEVSAAQGSLISVHVSSFFDDEFEEHAAVVAATRAELRDAFEALVDTCVASLKDGGKLLFFGNGGSAADAQHLATELTVRYVKNRPAIAAIALTTDSSAITAIGNDLGFEHLFARQIEAIGKPGDVAVGISTSGTSANVVTALKQARQQGLSAAALTGNGGSALSGVASPLLIVPSATTARVQEMHILLGQMLCGAIERELGYAD